MGSLCHLPAGVWECPGQCPDVVLRYLAFTSHEHVCGVLMMMMMMMIMIMMMNGRRNLEPRSPGTSESLKAAKARSPELNKFEGVRV